MVCIGLSATQVKLINVPISSEVNCKRYWFSGTQFGLHHALKLPNNSVKRYVAIDWRSFRRVLNRKYRIKLLRWVSLRRSINIMERRMVGWIMNDELGRIWNEAVVAKSRYYAGTCLEWRRKATTYMSGYPDVPGRDSNLALRNISLRTLPHNQHVQWQQKKIARHRRFCCNIYILCRACMEVWEQFLSFNVASNSYNIQLKVAPKSYRFWLYREMHYLD
jgi:hypothetical protein